jgi:hypothetical protein
MWDALADKAKEPAPFGPSPSHSHHVGSNRGNYNSLYFQFTPQAKYLVASKLQKWVLV